MCSDALLDQTDDLFDLTVGYSGIDKVDIPYEEYLVDRMFFCKHYPREVHIHIERHSIKSLPGMQRDTSPKIANPEERSQKKSATFDDETNERRALFNSWLKDRFMRKDDLMDNFYETGKLSEKSLRWKVEPTLKDWIVILSVWYCGLHIIPFFFRSLWFMVTSIWFVSGYLFRK
jgi:hypothetical protein